MQQINLYKAQFKPTKVILSPRQMMMILIALILSLSVMSLYSAKRNSILENTIKEQKKYAVQTLSESSESPLLIAELEKLNFQRSDKQRLIDYLTHQDFGNQQGFSATLRHLSKQQINNVWLTEFSLIQGGQTITLQGKSLQSSFIPLYIDSLAKSEHFKGKQFSVFQLQQPKGNSDVYTFKLNSEDKQVGRR